MNKNLLNLSGKIDQLTVSVYETITKVADSSGIKYFIVGASARDMILRHGHGIRTIRATVDIDIGIQLSNWNDYKKLSSDLINGGGKVIIETRQAKKQNPITQEAACRDISVVWSKGSN